MPHTLKYRPDLIDELISTTRIATYSSVFAPSNDLELVGVYLWNKQVVGNLLPLASAIEVSVRNQIDRVLFTALGPSWWKAPGFLTKNETSGNRPPPLKQWIIDGFDEAGRRFGKDQTERHGSNKRLHAPISHGDYIARTDMGTWEHLLDNQFNPLLWPHAIGHVFKGPAPLGVKKVKDKQNFAKTQLIAIRKLRNRIAHNEPVWKTATAANEADALKALNDRIGSMEDFLTFINPELHRMMSVNGFLGTVKRLATSRAIRSAQHQLPVKRIKSVDHLRDILTACHQNNEAQPVALVRGIQAKFTISPL